MDDFYQLVFAGVFAGSHIGKEVNLAVALHDGETRESFARETKVFFAGKNNIARGIIDASNHGIGLARFDHGAGGGEVGGFEGGDF